ncbi:VOC family protein [Olivibacter sp. SDN3]|uniref:VOC family protein n=1 Tax=Olivibacter sp. SDN3 TaxID=2764720 RepID=UPI0016512329|nr:VOC family protein [Olivibacter sp. SDN3]QNL49588.1 VOC family protein [Olivibacter sp. SDN3]
MSYLITYLTFNGNCREAMLFYQQCLGGNLSIQTIADSPLGKNFPIPIQKYILHASLRKGGLVLMGTDMVSDAGLVKGNTVSILLECTSEREMRTYYKNLSIGGLSTNPLEATEMGDFFGGLTDKFGNHWLLQYTGNN